jgi:hypothetical protein
MYVWQAGAHNLRLHGAQTHDRRRTSRTLLPLPTQRLLCCDKLPQLQLHACHMHHLPAQRMCDT